MKLLRLQYNLWEMLGRNKIFTSFKDHFDLIHYYSQNQARITKKHNQLVGLNNITITVFFFKLEKYLIAGK